MIMKKIWAYIKKLDLQDPSNRRNILVKEKLKELFPGKKKVSMFELGGLLGKHILKKKANPSKGASYRYEDDEDEDDYDYASNPDYDDDYEDEEEDEEDEDDDY
jgi:chromatin remodeling complex protein RSC6